MIAASIRVLRPHVKAEPVNLDELAEEMERCKPHLIICSTPNTVDPGGMCAWVELSVDQSGPARACIGGRHREYVAPLALDTLLEIVDDVEHYVRTHGELSGC